VPRAGSGERAAAALGAVVTGGCAGAHAAISSARAKASERQRDGREIDPRREEDGCRPCSGNSRLASCDVLNSPIIFVPLKRYRPMYRLDPTVLAARV
jgi:hypothetical protein